jgi:hypothetical protein
MFAATPIVGDRNLRRRTFVDHHPIQRPPAPTSQWSRQAEVNPPIRPSTAGLAR